MSFQLAPGLDCEGGGRLADTETPIVICDVGALRAADAATVEGLARLALGARRLGCVLRIEHASPELCALIAFMGLEDVLAAGEGGA
jgi:ABC-type transporter Mla MlaB component